MAKKTFKGRVVLPGKVTGKATVSRQAFNTSGSYMENMFGGGLTPRPVPTPTTRSCSARTSPAQSSAPRRPSGRRWAAWP